MGRLCGGAHEISDPNFSPWSGWGVVGGVIRLSFQSNSNSQKLSLWCKKQSLST